MGSKAEVQGVVVSDSMDQSVVVAVERRVRHGQRRRVRAVGRRGAAPEPELLGAQLQDLPRMVQVPELDRPAQGLSRALFLTFRQLQTLFSHESLKSTQKMIFR